MADIMPPIDKERYTTDPVQEENSEAGQIRREA